MVVGPKSINLPIFSFAKEDIKKMGWGELLTIFC